jgi:sulfur transfer complex TusBCD TusB component (DsrH family)
MKIGLLLKSGPGSDNAVRALQTAGDMLAAGHSVSLFLLQEGVRLCSPGPGPSGPIGLQALMDRDLEVHVLTDDARLRGIDAVAGRPDLLAGSYESLVDLMESCDQVIGIL